MSFRTSLVRLAQHARTPLIRFPDRTAKHSSHAATAHPCAPQSTVDAFSRFQHAQQNPRTDFSQSSSYGGPNAPPKTGGSSSGASLSSEEQLPAWLRRSRYAPTEEEIEAVMTGGASNSTPITKDYKLKWHIAQI
ncbi:hypothetical protein JCM6882_003691 [Rhodosporidiobolus microsporus]